MPAPLPDIIRRKLDRLKRLLRLYTALDGTALCILALILLLVCDFCLDRFFEFPQIIRLILLPLLTIGFGFVFGRQILRRCFVPLRSSQLAAVLENYVPNLNEALFTAVEQSDHDEFDDELMQQTITEAAAALHHVNVGRFFNTSRLILRLFSALLCAALLTVCCAAYSETAFLWFSRNILLSHQEYPRRSQLLVDGFQDGRVRIGRGDSFTLSVRANTEKPLVPDIIRVRIGTPDTGYRTLLLDQFHMETHEGTRWRVFSTAFPEMLETVMLQIRGADTTLNDFCIEVVPPPMLTNMTLRQQFPEYINRQERTVALTGRTMIPEGTDITISAESTKPLQDASAVINGEVQPLPQEEGKSLELSLPALREETLIDFRLTDTDSLTNRQPIRAELGIINDQPPVVTARLDGIGTAITPEAVLPIVGEITDDHGLASAMFRYTTEPASPEPAAQPDPASAETPRQPGSGTVPMDGLNSGQTLFPLAQLFSVTPLAVLPGDKLNLLVEASDLFDLDSSQGQVGAGQQFQLEIVTPEQLQTMLETREIVLRQRFEVVLGEVERTKTILVDYTLEPMEQQIQEAEALTLEEEENETPAERAKRQQELESKKQALRETILSEQAELGMYHIARMLRDTQKESYDLIGIVESFRGIRQEMINNRIFSEDERRRIDQDIMQPMQELTNRDFPDIDLLLGGLNQLLLKREAPNRPAAITERQRILEQFERTLQKMTAIRDKMASMESFNEAVELLRVIIRQQQQLKNETLEEKNQRLRDLLD